MICRGISIACLSAFMLGFSTLTVAQTAAESAEPSDLAAWALRLKDNFQEVTPSTLSSAKSALADELNRLDGKLSGSANGGG